MKKRFSIKISNLFAILSASFLTYYLLLCDNRLHTSISEIIIYSHSLAIAKHILVLGLLPIYIAAIVFGTAMFGVYLGLLLQHAVVKMNKNKQPSY